VGFHFLYKIIIRTRIGIIFGKTGPGTLFNIQCANGKVINHHSYFDSEDEVLLLPATQFIIVGKVTQRQLHIIQLKENVESSVVLLKPPFTFDTTPSTIMNSSVKTTKSLSHQLTQKLSLNSPSTTTPVVPVAKTDVHIKLSDDTKDILEQLKTNNIKDLKIRLKLLTDNDLKVISE
jgi:hypothetical protein